jgi:tRNA-dependent cyclodipeptide synthase
MKDHLIFAISPGNGYFTKEVVIDLVKWAYDSFRRLTILDPSDIYHYTLEGKEVAHLSRKVT